MNTETRTIESPGHVEANASSGVSPPDWDGRDPVPVVEEWTAALPDAERGRLGRAITLSDGGTGLSEAQRALERLSGPTLSGDPITDVGGWAAELPAPDRERLARAAGISEPGVFTFESVADVMAGEIEPPATLVEHLIYERRVHWLAGHPGHGKTTLAMYIAKRAMEDGRHVIWLDWEAGTYPTAARLRAVGVSAELARARFHLVASPTIDASEAGFEPVERALGDWPGALVVFDSASKALSVAGADENSATDATRWTTNIVMPVRDHGGTALVIDHVTKGATRSTPYARGAGSKLADTDVMWYVERRVPFSRERVGSIELHRHKDRDGALPETVAFEVGDGDGGLPLTETEATEAGEGEARRDAGLRARVLAVLEEHSTESEPLTANQVDGLAQGKRSAILDALKELASDPTSPVKAKPGPQQGVVYWHDPDAVNALSI